MQKRRIPATKRLPVSRSLWKKLGPGIITGAADDDPSGIATYSQAGAQFGFSTLWTVVLTYPLMCAIQEISARLGRVTGDGIAGNLRKHSSRPLLYFAVMLLLAANVLNLGADIGAMAAAIDLIFPGNYFIYVVMVGIGSAALQVIVPYHLYLFYLKWLTLSLLSYLAVMFFIKIPFATVLRQTFLPPLKFDSEYFKMVVAIFGTTLSPYLFFWQASQEVEDVTNDVNKKPLLRSHREGAAEFTRIRKDTYVGMFFSNWVAYSIIVTTGVTLNGQRIIDIDSAATAAKALEPLAGHFSFLLFALGIIGTGLLAIPVLAGSVGYAVGEALNWPVGLERKPKNARAFYGLIAIAIMVGVALNFLKINPMKALLYSAVLNGILAVPLMILIMRLSANSEVMGEFTISKPLQVMGWAATVIMAASLVGLFL